MRKKLSFFIVPMLRVGMRMRTLQRPYFICILWGLHSITMKTLERQRLHSNAERWNNQTQHYTVNRALLGYATA